jgi:hypothetical protein
MQSVEFDASIARHQQKSEPGSDRGRKLDILLDYIYAGKEKEGWAWFEKEYKESRKREVKASVIATLQHSTAYNPTSPRIRSW